MAITFSLDEFERHVYSRAHDQAMIQLIAALVLLHQKQGQLDEKQGQLDENFLASGMDGLSADEQHARFCTRLMSATSTLFANPEFHPHPEAVRLMLTLHQWIGVLFSSTPFGNADHIIRHLNPRGPEDRQFMPGDRFIDKICLLYSTESELEVDLAALWNHDKATAARLALVMLAPLFQGSANAHGKREALLEWLPGKLQQVDDLDDLPSAVLHNAYMFCSYGQTPRRHAIKRDINLLVRRKLAQLGLTDLPTASASGPAPGPGRGAARSP